MKTELTKSTKFLLQIEFESLEEFMEEYYTISRDVGRSNIYSAMGGVIYEHNEKDNYHQYDDFKKRKRDELTSEE